MKINIPVKMEFAVASLLHNRIYNLVIRLHKFYSYTAQRLPGGDFIGNGLEGFLVKATVDAAKYSL